MDTSDELIHDFIEEANDLLDSLDLGIVEMEKNPQDAAVLGRVFRSMHTLKGSSGFFGLKRLERVAHSAESVLGKLRDGELNLNPAIASALLQATDILRVIIASVETTGVEPPGDDGALIKDLHTAATRQEDPQPTAVEQSEDAPTPDDPIAQAATHDDVETDIDDAHEARAPTEIVEKTRDADPGTAKKSAQELVAPVKVSVQLIDNLMNDMSELVLARNRLLPYKSQLTDKGFEQTVAAIDTLTIELQQKILKTRMQPVGQLWGKIPRLVRDVANQSKKAVEVVFLGEDTEMDRAMLDAVRDPLLHLVRNCVDHGIETQAKRIALAKPPVGLIKVHARYENSTVVIEVSDDGAGISFDAIRRRIVDGKFLSSAEAMALSDAQALEMIFQPGFTTARRVTEISGRGVGMEVVKANITNVGGSIDVVTQFGLGTTFRIKLPLTLAIMTALFVQVGEEQYGIPQSDVSELIQYRLPDAYPLLEDYCGIPMCRVREELVPLIFLRKVLDIEQPELRPSEKIKIALMHVSGRRFGLVIDNILGIEELVIKPLPRLLRNFTVFSRATILGNGLASLILDINRIVRASRLAVEVESLDLLNANDSTRHTDADNDLHASVNSLLFTVDGLGETVLPLPLVYRIEQVDPDLILHSGGRELLKYGDGLMQLVRLSAYFDVPTAPPDSSAKKHLTVVVIDADHVNIGLIISQVKGTIDIPKKLAESVSDRPGLLGYAIVGDRLVNVLDINEFVLNRMSELNN